MSIYSEAFGNEYSRVSSYEKYNLGLTQGKGVTDKLFEICTVEELLELDHLMTDILNRKRNILSRFEMPEQIRLIRYSYYDLNGVNTGNIHTKKDYKIMANDIRKALEKKMTRRV